MCRKVQIPDDREIPAFVRRLRDRADQKLDNLRRCQRDHAGDLPDRIVDSHFSDLMADPVAAVEKLYGEMARPFLAEHADAIRRYVEAKPRGKFGRHRYSPEEWGFDPAKLRERMLPYTDYYGVALEA